MALVGRAGADSFRWPPPEGLRGYYTTTRALQDHECGRRGGEPTWRECHRQAGPTWRVSHRQAGPVVFNCHEGWPLRIRVLPGPTGAAIRLQLSESVGLWGGKKPG